MAKNYDEGLYFIGCESDGKIRLTEDGRRILNTNKKAIKGGNPNGSGLRKKQYFYRASHYYRESLCHFLKEKPPFGDFLLDMLFYIIEICVYIITW